jgi:hypothetical protein
MRTHRAGDRGADVRHHRSLRIAVWPVAVWIALAALLVPVLVARYPTLVDYPNHLARLWLLSGGAGLEPVSRMYRITWDTFTNIGIDVAGTALGLFLPIQIVGRVLVAAATVLTPLGGVLLWRELHGRWHWWQISFPLLAWGLGLGYKASDESC